MRRFLLSSCRFLCDIVYLRDIKPKDWDYRDCLEEYIKKFGSDGTFCIEIELQKICLQSKQIKRIQSAQRLWMEEIHSRSKSSEQAADQERQNNF